MAHGSELVNQFTLPQIKTSMKVGWGGKETEFKSFNPFNRSSMSNSMEVRGKIAAGSQRQNSYNPHHYKLLANS